MTRGGRRQFTSILDKFWGQYYDLHGREIGASPEIGMVNAISECRDAILKIEGLPCSPFTLQRQAFDEALDDCLKGDSFAALNSSVSGNPSYLFGLWCLFRLLELCQVESRPELWGRYALVLNRLQWMLPALASKAANGDRIEEPIFMDIANMLDSIEVWIKERKGPKGTGAGEVAFPKV